jgi:hypothetical protein
MSAVDRPRVASLPSSPTGLSSPRDVARFLANRLQDRHPALLLRYGDTGGRILSRPRECDEAFDYVRQFLGASISIRQVDWMADQIEASVRVADVIGLRSDLLGPNLPGDFLSRADEEVLPELAKRYPLRPVDRTTLRAASARRLAETRKAMENLPFQPQALFTDAWIHLGLTEVGFVSALLRQAPAISVVTSVIRRPVLERLASAMKGRLRVFDCPAYPSEEARWGGNHDYLWQRWLALVDSLRPVCAGEPLLISAGIWTKVIGPVWRERSGVAVDFGSVIDYFAQVPSRPAVLATKYGEPGKVPEDLSVERQLVRAERLEDFLT